MLSQRLLSLETKLQDSSFVSTSLLAPSASESPAHLPCCRGVRPRSHSNIRHPVVLKSFLGKIAKQLARRLKRWAGRVEDDRDWCLREAV